MSNELVQHYRRIGLTKPASAQDMQSLADDLTLFGTQFIQIVDGQPVRVDPALVQMRREPVAIAQSKKMRA